MAFPAGCIPGFDVSHYNTAINWSAAGAAGEAFVYCKTSQGTTWTDPTFINNWQQSKAAGLLRGAYHFFMPDVDVNAQVQNFLDELAAANGSPILNPGDLPPALDIETASTVSGASLVANALEWLQAVAAATGRTPLVYTSQSFWISNAVHSDEIGQYPLWIARYSSTISSPPVPASWKAWTIWQFQVAASTFAQGEMDFDAFRGSQADLNALAGL